MRFHISPGLMPESSGSKVALLALLVVVCAAVVIMVLTGSRRPLRNPPRKRAQPIDPRIIEGIVLKSEERIRKDESS